MIPANDLTPLINNFVRVYEKTAFRTPIHYTKWNQVLTNINAAILYKIRH